MTNFFDLPKLVRLKIYRLHLVHDEPINREKHDEVCKHGSGDTHKYTGRNMPALLAISKKADKEAAPIYYGENHFEFDPVFAAYGFAARSYPRHLRMVRKVTCAWKNDLAGEGFIAIARMKGLQELHIRVDEHSMVQQTAVSRHKRQMWSLPAEDLTPQQQLAIQRYPGMSSLLSISNVPQVDFIEFKNYPNPAFVRATNGPIPDGYLQTYVVPKLKGIRSQAASLDG